MRAMYCERLFSVFKKGWSSYYMVHLRARNASMWEQCDGMSRVYRWLRVHHHHRHTGLQQKQGNKSSFDKELKYWSGNGLEVSSTDQMICYCFLHTLTKRKYNTFE